MDNIIILENHEYKLEKIWRIKKNDLTRDSKGNLYPYPKAGIKWADKELFLKRLLLLNEFLDNKKRYDLYKSPRDCLLCDAKNVSTKVYKYNSVMWEDGLTHYIDVHNIEPSLQFKKFIYGNDIFKPARNLGRGKKKLDPRTKIIIEKIQKEDKYYVVLERNQLLILDALMIHGGYEKKYHDPNNRKIKRYSEHAGLIDFENYTVNKITVSGRTERVDVGDDEIYLPKNMDDMLDYEYIFHTHPPTPKPGGRVGGGILYEFPSIGDIFHFIDHHNDGNVIGSLVVTSEGLYNIRKNSEDVRDIDINEDELFKKYQKQFWKVQNESIQKYGKEFSLTKFYDTISQDVAYIKKLNNVLNKFDINIDYYPRRKDRKNKWYIDTVFLVFRENRK